MTTYWLDQIRVRLRQLDKDLQPPCSLEALKVLNGRMRSELGVELPEGYYNFLRQTDGLSFNMTFFAARRHPYVGEESENTCSLIDENLEYRELLADIGEYECLLVLGNSSLDHYVYDLRTNEYVVKDSGTSDIFARYRTFDELFEYAARKALGYPRSQSTA